jgi:hypothetical protein
LEPDKELGSAKKRGNIAKLAGVARLSPFADLSLINKFAERFSMDPDAVYNKSFDTVMNFHWLWKEQEEYQERYNEIEQMMSNSKQ